MKTRDKDLPTENLLENVEVRKMIQGKWIKKFER